MTHVEKLQREIILYSAGCTWEKATSEERIRANDVARLWALPREKAHLRELRRARGKTVGWCPDPSGYYKDGRTSDMLVTAKRTRFDSARVVLVPRRKR